MNEVGVVATSLGSALAAASSSVLQHRSARQAPHDQTHRLLGHLLTRPLWIAGLAAAGAGLVLHAVALSGGQLALVQTLLVTGVLFALPLSAVLEGRRPQEREWLLALAVVAGLAAFLVAASPAGGKVALDADVLAWTTVGGTAVVAGLTVAGLRLSHGHTPLFLGAAAGIGYGLVATLLKQTTAIAQTGAATVFTDWPVYALVATGIASLALTQLAYRVGPLTHSMPALTVADPATSILLGALAFHESLATAPAAVIVEVIGFTTMSVAAAQLARRTKADQRQQAPVRTS